MEQIERLLMMMLLVLFGAGLAEGGLLRDTIWAVVGFAVLTLLVVRPLSAWISLIGHKEPLPEKATIAFFGIRGVVSIYYIAFALCRSPFEGPLLIWNAVSLGNRHLDPAAWNDRHPDHAIHRQATGTMIAQRPAPSA